MAYDENSRKNWINIFSVSSETDRPWKREESYDYGRDKHYGLYFAGGVCLFIILKLLQRRCYPWRNIIFLKQKMQQAQIKKRQQTRRETFFRHVIGRYCMSLGKLGKVAARFVSRIILRRKDTSPQESLAVKTAPQSSRCEQMLRMQSAMKDPTLASLLPRVTRITPQKLLQTASLSSMRSKNASKQRGALQARSISETQSLKESEKLQVRSISETHSLKESEKLQGRSISETQSLKESEKLQGRSISEAHGLKESEKLQGRSISEAHSLKESEKLHARSISEATPVEESKNLRVGISPGNQPSEPSEKSHLETRQAPGAKFASHTKQSGKRGDGSSELKTRSDNVENGLQVKYVSEDVSSTKRERSGLKSKDLPQQDRRDYGFDDDGGRRSDVKTIKDVNARRDLAEAKTVKDINALRDLSEVNHFECFQKETFHVRNSSKAKPKKHFRAHAYNDGPLAKADLDELCFKMVRSGEGSLNMDANRKKSLRKGRTNESERVSQMSSPSTLRHPATDDSDGGHWPRSAEKTLCVPERVVPIVLTENKLVLAPKLFHSNSGSRQDSIFSAKYPVFMHYPSPPSPTPHNQQKMRSIFSRSKTSGKRRYISSERASSKSIQRHVETQTAYAQIYVSPNSLGEDLWKIRKDCSTETMKTSKRPTSTADDETDPWTRSVDQDVVWHTAHNKPATRSRTLMNVCAASMNPLTIDGGRELSDNGSQDSRGKKRQGSGRADEQTETHQPTYQKPASELVMSRGQVVGHRKHRHAFVQGQPTYKEDQESSIPISHTKEVTKRGILKILNHHNGRKVFVNEEKPSKTHAVLKQEKLNHGKHEYGKDLKMVYFREEAVDIKKTQCDTAESSSTKSWLTTQEANLEMTAPRGESIRMVESLLSVNEEDSRDKTASSSFIERNMTRSANSRDNKNVTFSLIPCKADKILNLTSSPVNLNLLTNHSSAEGWSTHHEENDLADVAGEKSVPYEKPESQCNHDSLPVITATPSPIGWSRVNKTLKSMSGSYDETKRDKKRDILKREGKRARFSDYSPMLFDKFILKSKNHIKNTLLLCKSATTTMHEKLNPLKPEGPGCVRASKMRSRTARFPTLLSFLNHIEQEDMERSQRLKLEKLRQKKRVSQCQGDQIEATDGLNIDTERILNLWDTQEPIKCDFSGESWEDSHKEPLAGLTSTHQQKASGQNKEEFENSRNVAPHFGSNDLELYCESPDLKEDTKHAITCDLESSQEESIYPGLQKVTKLKRFPTAKGNESLHTTKTAPKGGTPWKKTRKFDFRLWKKDALKKMKKGLDQKVGRRGPVGRSDPVDSHKVCASVSEPAEAAANQEQAERSRDDRDVVDQKSSPKEKNRGHGDISQALFAVPDPTRGSDELLSAGSEEDDKDSRVSDVLWSNSDFIRDILGSGHAGTAIADGHEAAVSQNMKPPRPKKDSPCSSPDKNDLTRLSDPQFSSGHPGQLHMSLVGKRHLARNQVLPSLEELWQYGLQKEEQMRSGKDAVEDKDSAPRHARKSEASSNHDKSPLAAHTGSLLNADRELDFSLTPKSVTITDINVTSRSYVLDDGLREAIHEASSKLSLGDVTYKTTAVSEIAHKCGTNISQDKSFGKLHSKLEKKPLTKPANEANKRLPIGTSPKSGSSPLSTKRLHASARKPGKSKRTYDRYLVHTTKHPFRKEATKSVRNALALHMRDGEVPSEAQARGREAKHPHSKPEVQRRGFSSYTSKYRANDIAGRSLTSPWRGTVAFRKRLQYLLQHNKELQNKQKHLNILRQIIKNRKRATVGPSISAVKNHGLLDKSVNESQASKSLGTKPGEYEHSDTDREAVKESEVARKPDSARKGENSVEEATNNLDMQSKAAVTIPHVRTDERSASTVRSSVRMNKGDTRKAFLQAHKKLLTKTHISDNAVHVKTEAESSRSSRRADLQPEPNKRPKQETPHKWQKYRQTEESKLLNSGTLTGGGNRSSRSHSAASVATLISHVGHHLESDLSSPQSRIDKWKDKRMEGVADSVVSQGTESLFGEKGVISAISATECPATGRVTETQRLSSPEQANVKNVNYEWGDTSHADSWNLDISDDEDMLDVRTINSSSQDVATNKRPVLSSADSALTQETIPGAVNANLRVTKFESNLQDLLDKIKQNSFGGRISSGHNRSCDLLTLPSAVEDKRSAKLTTSKFECNLRQPQTGSLTSSPPFEDYSEISEQTRSNSQVEKKTPLVGKFTPAANYRQMKNKERKSILFTHSTVRERQEKEPEISATLDQKSKHVDREKDETVRETAEKTLDNAQVKQVVTKPLYAADSSTVISSKSCPKETIKRVHETKSLQGMFRARPRGCEQTTGLPQVQKRTINERMGTGRASASLLSGSGSDLNNKPNKPDTTQQLNVLSDLTFQKSIKDAGVLKQRSYPSTDNSSEDMCTQSSPQIRQLWQDFVYKRTVASVAQREVKDPPRTFAQADVVSGQGMVKLQTALIETGVFPCSPGRDSVDMLSPTRLRQLQQNSTSWSSKRPWGKAAVPTTGRETLHPNEDSGEAVKHKTSTPPKCILPTLEHSDNPAQGFSQTNQFWNKELHMEIIPEEGSRPDVERDDRKVMNDSVLGIQQRSETDIFLGHDAEKGNELQNSYSSEMLDAITGNVESIEKDVDINSAIKNERQKKSPDRNTRKAQTTAMGYDTLSVGLPNYQEQDTTDALENDRRQETGSDSGRKFDNCQDISEDMIWNQAIDENYIKKLYQEKNTQTCAIKQDSVNRQNVQGRTMIDGSVGVCGEQELAMNGDVERMPHCQGGGTSKSPAVVAELRDDGAVEADLQCKDNTLFSQETIGPTDDGQNKLKTIAGNTENDANSASPKRSISFQSDSAMLSRTSEILTETSQCELHFESTVAENHTLKMNATSRAEAEHDSEVGAEVLERDSATYLVKATQPLGAQAQSNVSNEPGSEETNSKITEQVFTESANSCEQANLCTPTVHEPAAAAAESCNFSCETGDKSAQEAITKLQAITLTEAAGYTAPNEHEIKVSTTSSPLEIEQTQSEDEDTHKRLPRQSRKRVLEFASQRDSFFQEDNHCLPVRSDISPQAEVKANFGLEGLETGITLSNGTTSEHVSHAQLPSQSETPQSVGRILFDSEIPKAGPHVGVIEGEAGRYDATTSVASACKDGKFISASVDFPKPSKADQPKLDGENHLSHTKISMLHAWISDTGKLDDFQKQAIISSQDEVRSVDMETLPVGKNQESSSRHEYDGEKQYPAKRIDDLESLLNKELNESNSVGGVRQGRDNQRLFPLPSDRVARRGKRSRRAERSLSQFSSHLELYYNYLRENDGSLKGTRSNISQQLVPSTSEAALHAPNKPRRPLQPQRFTKLEEFLQKAEENNRLETMSDASRALSKLSSFTSVTPSSQEEEQLQPLLDPKDDISTTNDAKKRSEQPHQTQMITSPEFTTLDSLVNNRILQSGSSQNLRESLPERTTSAEKTAARTGNTNQEKARARSRRHRGGCVRSRALTDVSSDEGDRFSAAAPAAKNRTVTYKYRRNTVDSEITLSGGQGLGIENRCATEIDNDGDDVLKLKSGTETVQNVNKLKDETCESGVETLAVGTCRLGFDAPANADFSRVTKSAWVITGLSLNADNSCTLSSSSSSIVLSWVGSDLIDPEETFLSASNLTDEGHKEASACNTRQSNISQFPNQRDAPKGELMTSTGMIKPQRLHGEAEEIAPVAFTADSSRIWEEIHRESPSFAGDQMNRGRSSNVGKTKTVGKHPGYNRESKSSNKSVRELSKPSTCDSLDEARLQNLNDISVSWLNHTAYSCPGEKSSEAEKKQIVSHRRTASNRFPKCPRCDVSISTKVSREAPKQPSTVWNQIADYAREQPTYFDSVLRDSEWDFSLDAHEDKESVDLYKEPPESTGSYVQSAWAYENMRNGSPLISPPPEQPESHSSQNSQATTKLRSPTHEQSTSSIKWSSTLQESNSEFQKCSIYSNMPTSHYETDMRAEKQSSVRSPVGSHYRYGSKRELKRKEDTLASSHISSGHIDKQNSSLRKVRFENYMRSSNKLATNHRDCVSRPAGVSRVPSTESKDKPKGKVTLDDHLKMTTKSGAKCFKNRCSSEHQTKSVDSGRTKTKVSLEQHLSSRTEADRTRCGAGPAASENGTTESTSSPASLNWYKPQSLSSSTSVSNSQAAPRQQVTVRLHGAQPCEPDTPSHRQGTAASSRRQDIQRFVSGANPARSIPSASRGNNQRDTKSSCSAQRGKCSQSREFDRELVRDSSNNPTPECGRNADRRQTQSPRRSGEATANRLTQHLLPPQPAGTGQVNGSRQPRGSLADISRSESRRVTTEDADHRKQTRGPSSNNDRLRGDRRSPYSLQNSSQVRSNVGKREMPETSSTVTGHMPLLRRSRGPSEDSAGQIEGVSNQETRRHLRHGQRLSPESPREMLASDQADTDPETLATLGSPTSISQLPLTKRVSKLVEMFEKKK